ncbi:MAG: hypothetical protein ACXAC5_02475 [Promethearchaeota archaeon]
MNWLQKISSVTFSLEESHRIAQPKTVFDLANDLNLWAHENAPRYFTEGNWQVIDQDGLDTSEMTGTINWYYDPEKIPPSEVETIPDYMRQWFQEELAALGCKINIRGPEQSNAFKQLRVYRLDILNNPTEEYPEMPWMNLSNDNAQALLGMLNIPNLQGSIDLGELRARIQGLTQPHMREFTMDTTDEGMGPGRHIDFGRELVQMMEYVVRLENMIDFGLRNEFTTLQWG